MHLKRVELENFKSFGRKLSIPFLDGFTAITGPNGSGKSNIGDAVLFVLGPKSNKAIRAGKLTDLIFNGGKEKKPADRCQVSLVFDNVDRVIPVDADEVALTRLVKLSKSNDENYYSYFYVNGKPSSLTEFDSLLAQSRISAEGYNIVRQGDILRIVDLPPVQRRAIVDEIAGITRFDSDIEKANKEKAEVQSNLERIGIILTEIEAQLRTLEREREHALKFKTLKDDLDLTKAKHARRRKDALDADLSNVRRLIESETAERDSLDQELAKTHARVKASEERLAKIDQKMVERAGPEAKELKAKLEEVKRVAVQSSERLGYATTVIAEIKETRAASTTDLKRQEKEIAKHAKEKDALAAQHDKSAASLTEAEARLERLRDRVSASTGKASDIQRELHELKIRHEKTGIELHEAKLSHERVTERIARLKAAQAENEEARETQRFELQSLSVDEEGLVPTRPSDVEALKKEAFALKKKEASLSQELRELEIALRRLQTDYSQLKAQQDANEQVSRGYNKAVQAILEARDGGKLRGIRGTIAELAEVKEKHALAMEVAAGMGRMVSIVTDTDEDAAAAIDFLKRNRLGRATFLPLNKMAPGRPAGKPLMAVRDPEAEGFAIDLIKFDEEYRNAFWYVFRDTVVVKKLDVARRLMGGVRLVTLEGDLIDSGGAMTGGDKSSASAGQLKFGANEAAQFEDVSKRLRATIAQQEYLSAQLTETRATLETMESRARDASSAAHEHATRSGDIARRKAEVEARMEALTGQFGETARELLASTNEAKDLDRTIARLTADLEGMERQRVDRSQLLLASTPKDLAKELETEDRAAIALRERTRDLKSQLDTKAHALGLLEERRQELADRVTEAERKIAEEEANVAKYAHLARTKEEELAVLLAMDAQQNEALQGLHRDREAAMKERIELASAVDKAVAARNHKDDQLHIYRGRVPVIEAALVEIREELALFPNAPSEVAESVDELRQRVGRLERQLEGLGNVNMLALDEYDRQAARRLELEAEKTRLETERDHLIALVGEIVAKKKEGFFKVYDEINVNFGKVYDRLTGGGKAELILENPEDPFAGGLTMRAQPKGKKVTRLEALSGGEKSLTSMAFIFAIQEFDPSPFYYLDEVDQNLDGINSELLARMIKDESSHAQFIVVSLRKVTLKEAEHVYGVTMMDSGLSEVIGEVRISELADEPPTPEAVQ